MALLLDTLFVLWYAKADQRLPQEVFQAIEGGSVPIAVSEVSLLEVAIKSSKNPSAMPYSPEKLVSFCEANSFVLRPITREAIFAYGSLNVAAVGDVHKDPFDRLLIAHAKSEGLTFATHNRLLALYGEPCVQVFA